MRSARDEGRGRGNVVGRGCHPIGMRYARSPWSASSLVQVSGTNRPADKMASPLAIPLINTRDVSPPVFGNSTFRSHRAIWHFSTPSYFFSKQFNDTPRAALFSSAKISESFARYILLSSLVTRAKKLVCFFKIWR